MFKKARIKLTAWYLLILMTISVCFSVVIYQGATAEIQRALSFQRFRIENPGQEFIFPRLPRRTIVDPEVLEESKNRIINRLILINAIILVSSGTAGYFLAGRTLKPISAMIDEQNRFVSDASHELRTPLTAMKTEVEVALRDSKMNLKQAKKLISSHLEEVNHMQSLSNYLLSLNRYQNTSLKFEFKKVRLDEILNKVREKILPLTKEKNISILIEGKEIDIEANPDSIAELFTILLDNAVKYSHKNSAVNIKTELDHKYATIAVQDYGIGIKEADIPYIFDRFYRADSSRTKTKTDGYGLGLSIAKQIVKIHRGSINVESKLDKGSTFIVQLPLKQNPK